MSEKEPKQTLIQKEEDEQWRKVLHAEIPPEAGNENQINAAKIRSYLLARDEALAVSRGDDTRDLETITAEEARVIYRQVTEEIRRRGHNVWLDYLRTYGVGFLIGGLVAIVAFLGFFREPGSLVAPSPVLPDGLNFSDYPIMKVNEEPGLFPNMLLIPGGRTIIGCSKGWDDAAGGCRPNEFPPHPVSIDTFEIAQHEVTVGQFAEFVKRTGYLTDAEKRGRGCVHEDLSLPGHPFVMNEALTWKSPGYPQNNAYPVTCVSWHDAQRYVEWLSKETATVYRLPSESEWEHAARGGQLTAYFWGSVASSDQANYKGVAGKDKWKFASPVGQFPANKYSVQDTSGNLWEWVQDCFNTTYQRAPDDGSARREADCKDPNNRVRRGGAWDANTAGIRSANRSPGFKNDRSNLYGFRVARDWQKK
jgi:formylglycine-generating enzyme required for sulfatase activity